MPRSGLAGTSLPEQGLAIFAGGGFCLDSFVEHCAGQSIASNVVDIFSAMTGQWATAQLSVPRFFLAAASLPNLGWAVFAGGWIGPGFELVLFCFCRFTSLRDIRGGLIYMFACG
jgi:hypothetical protein